MPFGIDQHRDVSTSLTKTNSGRDRCARWRRVIARPRARKRSGKVELSRGGGGRKETRFFPTVVEVEQMPVLGREGQSKTSWLWCVLLASKTG